MDLYHYCSNEIFHSIISSREVRLSSLTLSNDYTEGGVAKSVFLSLIDEKDWEPHEQRVLQEIVEDVNKLTEGLGFCLSRKEDLLSQWRGYADDGKGVSIGFSREYFELLAQKQEGSDEDRNFEVKDIEYDIDKQKEMLMSLYQAIYQAKSDGKLDGLRYVNARFLISPRGVDREEKQVAYNKAFFRLYITLLPLFEQLYSMKSPAFAEEQEVRLVTMLDKSNIKPGSCSFHSSVDSIKPYRAYQLEVMDMEPIVSVTLGPKNKTPIYIIESFLKQNGYEGVTVKKSKIPYS